jgi:hypothetical protein
MPELTPKPNSTGGENKKITLVINWFVFFFLPWFMII